MIVVEGPDGSGKSTLVAELQEMFGFDVVRWNKPPKSAEELAHNLRTSKDLIKTEVIQDHIPWITEPIYDVAKNGADRAATWFHYQTAVTLFRSTLIYCRPPMRVIQKHAGDRSSPCDTADYLAWVERNCEDLVGLYDLFMSAVRPAITYDWTRREDKAKLLVLAATLDRTKIKASIIRASKGTEPRPPLSPTSEPDD
ncbi:MAG: hypothetical protein KAT00_15480 [Planctomycetes bacterium]|nr:hypothetical protein [Planctomycetota bacterium]